MKMTRREKERVIEVIGGMLEVMVKTSMPGSFALYAKGMEFPPEKMVADVTSILERSLMDVILKLPGMDVEIQKAFLDAYANA
jgi:hypothetical protein